MTERISRLRQYIFDKKHHVFRKNAAIDPGAQAGYLTGELHARTAARFQCMLENQDVVFLPEDQFIPTRTTADFPDILTDQEREQFFRDHFIHELGYVCNICPDYSWLIANGIDKAIEKIDDVSAKNTDSEKKAYYESCKKMLKAVLDFSERYRNAAKEQGYDEIYRNLEQVPKKGASSFFEALQFFRLIHFSLWCEGDYHVIVGRFDQFMYPYFKKDMDSGVLDRDSALEMLEDFFLSFNKDSDLYRGMQQGDNGQSLVLGGYDEDGNDCYNELSELCLKASLELNVIDPKINLRVSKETSAERYAFASELTAKGLGFPQYSNDDIVVAGLLEKGYTKQDAVNYVVAACWEFIIPGKGMDIPNIDALSLLRCVDRVIRKAAAFGDVLTFDHLLKLVYEDIDKEVYVLCEKHKNRWMRPAPLMSFLMDGCIEKGKDISEGCVYNNYGIHGVGIANAADSLAVVKKLVFEQKEVSLPELVKMLDENYEGYEAVRNYILQEVPKMGNNDDEADDLGAGLLQAFADACEGIMNEKGGVYRAGTGTAMFYAAFAKDVPATADGRKYGDYLPANYSPALNVKLNGPFSVIQSFTKPNLSKAINGGPLTLEIAASSIHGNLDKLGLLVKGFTDLGGHQLQLNVLQKEQLIKAQENPEAYRNLVVRVWGWSGYFIELDKIYQDQIIQRADLSM